LLAVRRREAPKEERSLRQRVDHAPGQGL
jgi:hypothetical protein